MNLKSIQIFKNKKIPVQYFEVGLVSKINIGRGEGGGTILGVRDPYDRLIGDPKLFVLNLKFSLETPNFQSRPHGFSLEPQIFN